MPKCKHLVVEVNEPSVADADGKQYEEYGARITGKDKNVASCFIESVPGKQFRIVIWVEPALYENFKGWNLLATLRLNGNENAERLAFVWIDPRSEDFRRYGRVRIESKPIRDYYGDMREATWAFSEVGIDVLFEEMALNGDTMKEKAPQVDGLIESLEATGLEDEEGKESTGAMIEITIERIILDHHSKTNTYFDEDLDCDMRNAGTRNGRVDKYDTHVLTADLGDRIADWRPTQAYFMYNEEEPPYAVFKFYYKSGDALRKLGLKGDPKDKTATAPIRKLPEFQPLGKRKPDKESSVEESREHKKPSMKDGKFWGLRPLHQPDTDRGTEGKMGERKDSVFGGKETNIPGSGTFSFGGQATDSAPEIQAGTFAKAISQWKDKYVKQEGGPKYPDEGQKDQENEEEI